MGRRKIEIRAIKDDRNRSVTFLKRKGGLFKKAYELSVLCSVDVAVIIFGHNKKLYEFSSGDINETLRRYQYYGQPHEHKGPVDFKNKGGDDDEEDEEDEEQPPHTREGSLPAQHVPHMQHHNSFAHIQQPMASVSPPMPNGMFQPRHATPQPPHMISRPASQNMVRRTSSHLVPMQHPHPTPPPPQNGFAYAPNPPIYNPQAAPAVAPQPSPQPSFQQYSQAQQPPHPTPPPPQTHQQMQQSHQQYLQEQRRSSQPPPVSQPSLQPPTQTQTRASPQPEPQGLRPSEQSSPPQAKHAQSKSRSIFTPIDEGGSVLAQHFFGAPDPPRLPLKKEESSPDIKPPPRSVTVPSIPRPSSQPVRPQTTVPEFAPPQRTDTSGSRSGGRPKLNLQIPSEPEDDESGGGGSPLQSAGPSANPARGTDHIVLPPPSPSASAVMSAGTSGPPNPFARPPPPPPSNQNRDAYTDNRNNIETPISALPSRYMNNDLLPSPSNFFSEWYESGRTGGMNSGVLPSPLVFPTPADSRGLGFGGRDAANEANGEKRKGSVDHAEKEGDAKKVKT
ncbi:MADS-box transcription factor, other eukaryote [Capronia epimyces CBS 606.96]|uniref:MADS-box transcription factor, other eukaryote n=1 Tax=Capronia epimyces CBS 606.96 TaxID=1182542 RepID=W9XDX1_9EURO|nr:MADS-box transcription factor, other eukaryote [Capronia epimyces CBS 606.96]EXJ78368.1 MADS-box transcription factor, other eukaryote [Capronia epimyces CBS 606.96]